MSENDKNKTSYEIIKEAIFLASPSFYKQWIQNKADSLPEKITIHKYLQRMRSRCTPFGLFAGCSLGTISRESNIEMGDVKNHNRTTRLDMDYLCAVFQKLNEMQGIEDNQYYIPNDSLYKVGDKWRYIEYRYQGGRRIHFIEEVEDVYCFDAIFELAKKGSTISELSQFLEDEEITKEEAVAFLYELIENQILISNCSPSVTGEDLFEILIKQQNSLNGSENFSQSLEKIRNYLKEIDESDIGKSLGYYEKIISIVDKLGITYKPKHLFQTDLSLTFKSNTLDINIVEQIREALLILNKLTPVREETSLTKFRDNFLKRYEGEEVSLAEVMDTDIGIGFLQNSSGDISPLIGDLRLPFRRETQKIPLTNLQQFLLQKHKESILLEKEEVEITLRELNDFKENWNDLPVTFSVLTEVLSKKNNDYIVHIKSAGGSSAANLLGRFCHMDEDIKNHVIEIVAKEDEFYKDKIVAEIVHLPEARTGNILFRPALRKYEIPYLAKPSVDFDCQIPISDLMISVKNNKQIVLRSKRLNKEIIPRLSNAHNFSSNALPIYQFLCELQTQGKRGSLYFNWGSLLSGSKFLPRVRFKNIILFLATWNVSKDEINFLLDIKEDEKLVQHTNDWREERKIPKEVWLIERDNELLINFNDVLSIRMLLKIVKKKPNFQMKEFLFDGDNALVKRGNESFSNQMVFAFYMDKQEE